MKSNSEIKLIAVVGPTGSGKTALAVELAKQFNGVIISADSRQVYRGLDIGTNKEGVPGEWQGQPCRIIDGVPQLLIDVVAPAQSFTLASWLVLAKAAIKQVNKAGKLPIVAGGTGLYVSALLSGYRLGEGRYSKKKIKPPYDFLILSTSLPRDVLKNKSDKRFELIFDDLCYETKQLIDCGISGNWLDKIGLDYRFASRYLRGGLTRNEAIIQFQSASRAYIRRQLTWWRHHEPVVTVYSLEEAVQTVELFLKKTDRARTLKT